MHGTVSRTYGENNVVDTQANLEEARKETEKAFLLRNKPTEFSEAAFNDLWSENVSLRERLFAAQFYIDRLETKRVLWARPDTAAQDTIRQQKVEIKRLLSRVTDLEGELERLKKSHARYRDWVSRLSEAVARAHQVVAMSAAPDEGLAPDNPVAAGLRSAGGRQRSVRWTDRMMADVAARYEAGELQRDIGRSYGVSDARIGQILNRWRRRLAASTGDLFGDQTADAKPEPVSGDKNAAGAKEVAPDAKTPAAFMAMSLADLNEECAFSPRLFNCLKNIGCQVGRDIVRMRAFELANTPNLGRGSMSELRDILVAWGVRLGMTDDEIREIELCK